MKYFSFLLVPFLALFLISCSEEHNNLSPVSPETELSKAYTENNNDLAYAYPYLQTFNQVDLKNWTIEAGVVTVELLGSYENITQMFCVVELKESSQLYFLERPGSNSLKFELPSKRLVSDLLDVRIYAIVNNEVAPRILFKGSSFPYGYMQYFQKINVLEYNTVDGNDLDVYSAEFGTMKELFAEIKKDNNQNCLMFLQRPVNEHFVIPYVVDNYFSDVKLYGLF